MTGGDNDTNNLQMLSLLLQCAEYISSNSATISDCYNLLLRINHLSSPYGSCPERVAAYFSDALRYRLIASSSSVVVRNDHLKFLSSNAKRMLKIEKHRRIYQAFQHYNSMSPLVKFSHFTANQAILEAVDGEESVHIVDLDIMQGLQWPGLFQILASRPNNVKMIKCFKITGVGPSIELLEATGRRLSDFAAALEIKFEFCPVEGKISEIDDIGAILTGNEVTVVNWMQHRLYDSIGSDFDAIRIVKELQPKLITIVNQDINTSLWFSFSRRFLEALRYYSALFDALSDTSTVERGSLERHTVERQVFGCEIRNIMAMQYDIVTKVEGWGDKFSKHGFRQVSLAGNPATQASLLLGMHPWKGYTLVEENGCLKLGWKDTSLLTATAWQPISST
ncbi:Scarecrow-like protein 23 [Zostera marina]|uniref:Scarecrow-like protein 23 n=1 Tax=Zostera marina TaxID=29655 RepID=A0A0K9PIQ9_ZOSMR|nr:Scarecrow-like protein 23 [Zostera marina]